MAMNLDIAAKQGVLADVSPSPEFDSGFAAGLFSGVQPSNVKWTEQFAFRHYLTCLHAQVSAAGKGTFTEVVDRHRRWLDAAEELLARLHSVGVKGQLRDFRESIDANHAAINVLVKNRGPLLRRKWKSLI